MFLFELIFKYFWCFPAFLFLEQLNTLGCSQNKLFWMIHQQLSKPLNF